MESLTFEDLIDADGLYTPSRTSLSSVPSSSSASAFRRFTKSPSNTIRSSIRRSLISNSSTDSLDSHEQRVQPQLSSCVSQQTSRDDCSLSRFIAWAAVRRNASKTMTPEQKKECPLIRCRQRFPNQELMLQHLAGCDKLCDGEYWCFDCQKRERFTEAKCSRCIGHPSKRRKIVKLAKSIFSSLGHKARNIGNEDFDLLADEVPLPLRSVSDSASNLVLSDQSELGSAEIHELDSSEKPLLSPIVEEEDVDISATFDTLESFSGSPVAALTYSAPHPTAHESEKLFILPKSFTRSLQQSPAIPSSSQLAPKPVLQVQTTGFEPYRNPSFKRRRHEKLSHSASTRSNASVLSNLSTDSTVSTNSTSSDASYAGLSITSDWPEHGWRGTRGGYDSPITTPMEDRVNIDNFFPPTQDELNKMACQANTIPVLTGQEGNCQGYMPELPGDVPALNFPGTPACQLEPDFSSVPSAQPLLSLVSSSDMSINQQAFGCSLSDQHILTGTAEPTLSSWPAPSVSPESLVQALKVGLDVHFANSVEGLRHMSENSIVSLFISQSSAEVAATGLDALSASLQGQIIGNPVHLLCLIHLVYVLSLVMHEDSAPDRWTNLFPAALCQSSGLPRPDRKAYLDIVKWLWSPRDMSDDELGRIIRHSPPDSYANEGKKNVSSLYDTDAISPIVSIAQEFLDELDYLASQSVSPEVQISRLFIHHLRDQRPEPHLNAVLIPRLKTFFLQLQIHYAESALFVQTVRQLSQMIGQRILPTARRLELVLIHTGRMHLTPQRFMQGFVQRMRNNVDIIYQQVSSHSSSRMSYHLDAMDLIRNLLPNPDPKPHDPDSATGAVIAPDDSITDILKILDAMDDMDTYKLDNDPDISSMLMDPTTDVDLSSNDLLGSLHQSPEAPFFTPPSGVAPATSPLCASMTGTDANFSSSFASTPVDASGALKGCSPNMPTATATLDAEDKIESNSACNICGYRPKGDPKWFAGSMAKHKKKQHGPQMIFSCPFPNCKSQFKNRRDNLRSHQIEKGHFVEGEDQGRRSGKRKRSDE